MRTKVFVNRMTQDENDLEHFVFDICVRIFDGIKQVGELKGKAFEAYQLHQTDLFCCADDWGIDLEMMQAAARKKLLDKEVMVLDTLEIEQSYRGRGLGIKMMKQAIKAYCKNFRCWDLTILLHPCPLVWPDKEAQDEGRKALSNYYAKHFPIQRIKKGSHYFYFTVDNQTAL